jgi:hypothetical protein
LILANGEYDDDALRRLTAPAHDAEALERVLANPLIGRFEVTVIQDRRSGENRLIEDFFANGRPDDLLVLYFAGHGLKSSGGKLYLAATNTRPARLDSTAVAAESVNAQMASSRARRIVVFLDCCYGGAFERGALPRADETIDVSDAFPDADDRNRRVGEGRGRVVITASSAMQYAFEDGRLTRDGVLRPSVFTGALVRGLETGEADLGGDGLVDVDELYEYLHAAVTSMTSEQTPGRSVNQQEGKVSLAWTPPARRIEASAIPDELDARTLDGTAETRLSAARELRRLLLDDDVGQAAGALDALRRLATDDSAAVAAAAAAAIEEAQLRASPAHLELVAAAPDGGEQPATVRLVGSPLARVFQATTTSRWLRIEQTQHAEDTTVRVLVDQRSLPAHHGRLRADQCRTGSVSSVPVVVRTGGRLVTTWFLPTSPVWLHGPKVLPLLGLGIAVGVMPYLGPILEASGLLGIGYFVLRFSILFAGITLLIRDGTHRSAGWGLSAATVCYFAVAAVTGLHSQASSSAWLEFAAVAAFAGALVLRLRPYLGLLRRRPVAPPTGSPLANLVLGGAALQALLLFVVNHGQGTVANCSGGLAAVLSLVPATGLCVATALTPVLDRQEATFVTAAIAAYFGPELYFFLGSLLVSSHFAYLGTACYDISGEFDIGGEVSAWFLLAQVAATLVTAVPSLLIAHRAAQVTS